MDLNGPDLATLGADAEKDVRVPGILELGAEYDELGAGLADDLCSRGNSDGVGENVGASVYKDDGTRLAHWLIMLWKAAVSSVTLSPSAYRLICTIVAPS